MVLKNKIHEMNNLLFCSASLLLLAAVRGRPGNENRKRRVVLVGSGPGAIDLITLRGFDLISKADFIVHDRLVSPKLLDGVKPSAILINVGKGPEKDRYKQSEINEELIRLATDTHNEYRVFPGAIIVRLKGGDPFVYGLGGDEVLALKQHGISCQVVPGISSALAVPATVGIPLTHKGVATSFTVLTGHIPPGQTGGADWDNLPRTLSTLVILMGVKHLQVICGHLVDQGWNAHTDVAIVESGTTDAQRVALSTLGQIGEIADKVKSPAIIVVGEVCTVLGLPVENSDEISSNEVWGVARSPV